MVTMKKSDRDDPSAAGARRPRRVLAGFGRLADEVATIDAALALARALHAEIAGHFVEESNLLDLADLPFAQAVRSSGQATTPIEAGRMKRELAHAASTWRRTLRSRAERSRIACTFRTSTGEYCSEISKVTAESDFVIVNPANVARQGLARARTVLDAFATYAGLVVLPEHRQTRKGPVLLLLDPETDRNAPVLAQRIAEAAETDLAIIASTGADADETAMRSRIADAIGPGARIQFSTSSANADLITDASALDPSFIVWPGWNVAEDKDLAEGLLRTTNAPLLLLRQMA